MKKLALATAIVAILGVSFVWATEPIDLPQGCPKPSEFTTWELTYVVTGMYNRYLAEALFDCFYKELGENPRYVNGTFVRSWVTLEQTWTRIFIAQPSPYLPEKYEARLYAYEDDTWKPVFDSETLELYKGALRNVYGIEFEETTYQDS